MPRESLAPWSTTAFRNEVLRSVLVISSFRIEGFRGFQDFQMGDLGRVNLFVGANNSGKTSLLEALYLLASRADPLVLARALRRRGEVIMDRSRSQDRDLPEVDASHLFFGHKCQLGARFKLSAANREARQSLTATVVALTMEERASMRMRSGETPTSSLRLNGSPQPVASDIPLDASGAFSAINVDRGVEENTVQPNVVYITTQPMHGADLVAMWNNISLTEDEDLVLDMLQSFDNRIERIAPQMPFRGCETGANRSGFVIKHLDSCDRIPIGSMGDGLWNLLSMAIAITQCRDGILLIDGIDEGLDVSAMSCMWKMIISAARALDVQVFATTHSSDCVNSLAQQSEELLAGLDRSLEPVVLQRIERDRRRATPYTSRQIQIASDQLIDLRR